MLHLGQLTKSVTNAATASFESRKERKRRKVYISRTTFGLQKIVSATNVDFIQAVQSRTNKDNNFPKLFRDVRQMLRLHFKASKQYLRDPMDRSL